MKLKLSGRPVITGGLGGLGFVAGSALVEAGSYRPTLAARSPYIRVYNDLIESRASSIAADIVSDADVANPYCAMIMLWSNQ